MAYKHTNAQARMTAAQRRQWRQVNLLLFIFDGHLEPGEWITWPAFRASLAKYRFDFLRAATQIHQFTGEVHALFYQPQVLVLTANISYNSVIVLVHKHKPLSEKIKTRIEKNEISGEQGLQDTFCSHETASTTLQQLTCMEMGSVVVHSVHA